MAKEKLKKSRSQKVAPLGKIHGGKAYLARRILALHPDPITYNKHVEPYGGLASVKLNLPSPTRQSPRIDVYNDMNCQLVNMFTQLRDNPDTMRILLQTTMYCEAEFRKAQDPAVYAAACDAEKARLAYILHQMSFGGRKKDFSRSKSRTRRGIADVVSGHLGTIHDMLPTIMDIVQCWQIENQPAIECMKYHDGNKTMFYLDPPYLPATRAKGSRKTYGEHEMTYEQHEELLAFIRKLKGKVLISGYSSDLYIAELEENGWIRHEFEIANHAAGPGKQKRRMVECAWSNYEVPK